MSFRILKYLMFEFIMNFILFIKLKNTLMNLKFIIGLCWVVSECIRICFSIVYILVTLCLSFLEYFWIRGGGIRYFLS